VLDMDGLLIDTEPAWRQAEAAVFSDLGSHLSEEEMLGTMGRRITEVVAHWRWHRPWPAALSGDPDDADIAARILDRVVDHVRTRGEAMPGVREAVALLRRLGLGLAIASSSPPRLIDAVCQRLGLVEIEVRCSAVDEARGKPAPDVFLSAARRLDLPPATCLAIEDSPNGVLAAKAAGMRCVAVPDPHLRGHPGYREADLVVASLLDLDEAALRSLGSRTG
jgi:HAD superfamily hydrolase (TIGR01509 family)